MKYLDSNWGCKAKYVIILYLKKYFFLLNYIHNVPLVHSDGAKIVTKGVQNLKK